MPNVAILIPVFNGLKHTMKCLSVLYELKNSLADPGRISIIVIDDGSSDGTSEWITNNYHETTILHGDGSLWWSGAINQGMNYAFIEHEYDYVLWWNNDITPSSDYLYNLVRIIDNSDVVIGGSKIYYADKKNIIWSMGGIFDTRTGKKYMIAMDEADSDKYNNVVVVDWLPGMGTFIHKSVFAKIGFTDNKSFPQYHGDSDFTFRATLAGYTIKVYPELKIWNDKSNSGLLHGNSFNQLIRSLTDLKSNYHIKKDIDFYRRYATSSLAYQTLAYKYCFYIGGFIKWKLLNLFGFSKKSYL